MNYIVRKEDYSMFVPMYSGVEVAEIDIRVSKVVSLENQTQYFYSTYPVDAESTTVYVGIDEHGSVIIKSEDYENTTIEHSDPLLFELYLLQIGLELV